MEQGFQNLRVVGRGLALVHLHEELFILQILLLPYISRNVTQLRFGDNSGSLCCKYYVVETVGRSPAFHVPYMARTQIVPSCTAVLLSPSRRGFVLTGRTQLPPLEIGAFFRQRRVSIF